MIRNVTRREFLQSTALSGLAVASKGGMTAHVFESFPEKTEGLKQFVNVFIGTGGHGHCYPGATLPFGMVQLSPDTGYHHDDT
jgi:putative alpha-1,2-mannosidase